MKARAVTSPESFSTSSSLFDVEGRLVDWDAGFAQEFVGARDRLAPGASGPEICAACLLPRSALDFSWHVQGPAPPPSTYANGRTTVEVTQQWSGAGRILRLARVVPVEPLRVDSGNADEIPLLRSGLLQISQSVLARRSKEEEALRAARAEAELANMAKSQFLATMSHEIRTPLNGVLGMAQLLMAPDLSDSDRLRYSRIILHSGQTLLTLLNDILDLSKVEAGKLELSLSTVDLQDMFDELVELFSAAGMAKGVQLSCDARLPTGYRISADAVRLRQMVTNLLGNAVKFTESGSIRTDCVELARTADSVFLELSVADTGIGIPLEKQSQLFEPFVQADASTTRTYGGTGLGLSIVRKLAQLMGGEVGLESAAGKGSRFWFRIRVAMAASESAALQADDVRAVEPPESRSISGDFGFVPCVLVVEDNAVNQIIVESMLRSIGMTANIAENGQLGLNAVVEGMQPDVILMDVQMPVMDGIDATRRIRAWERENNRRRLPIIALSAGVFAEDLKVCAEAGMDDFLDKPIDVSKLRAVMAKWLNRLPV